MALPISISNTETQFADGEFTVTAGTPVSLYITIANDGPIPGGVNFELAHKTAGGKYNTLIILNASNIMLYGTITAAGTWAVRRHASTVSAGLEAV